MYLAWKCMENFNTSTADNMPNILKQTAVVKNTRVEKHDGRNFNNECKSCKFQGKIHYRVSSRDEMN